MCILAGMKIAALLICIPLLLALAPPKRPKITKDILGLWAMHLTFSLETRNQPTAYGKTKDPESALYEFKKSGAVVSQNMAVYCNTGGTPERINEKIFSTGVWTQLSDSTLILTFKHEESETRQICWLYRNKAEELEFRLYPMSK